MTSRFNEVLQEARGLSELSIQQAADRTGFTPGFIRSYEDCADNPTAKTLFAFARAYGLRVTINMDGVTIEHLRSGNVLLTNWSAFR